jgi:hypothetical protein
MVMMGCVIDAGGGGRIAPCSMPTAARSKARDPELRMMSTPPTRPDRSTVKMASRPSSPRWRASSAGATQIRFVCLLAAPEGIAALTGEHPDVAIFTAGIDRELDAHSYIRPGLGDAGDRLYGTK